jgi:adenylosuccinate synthase
VYERFPGWAEDISGVRHFADLPANARRYVAGMVKAILDVAYEGVSWPASLPNLRYLGVGPGTSQIIKDVPPATELLRSA